MVVWSLPLVFLSLLVLKAFFMQHFFEDAWSAYLDGTIGFVSASTALDLFASAVVVYLVTDVAVGLPVAAVFWVIGSLPFRSRFFTNWLSSFAAYFTIPIISLTDYFLMRQAWLAASILGARDGSRYVEAGSRFWPLIFSSLGVMVLMAAVSGWAGYRWGLRAYPDCDRSSVRGARQEAQALQDTPACDDSWKPFGDAAGDGR